MYPEQYGNLFLFRLAKKQLLERLYQGAEARKILQWSLIMHFAVLIGCWRSIRGDS